MCLSIILTAETIPSYYFHKDWAVQELHMSLCYLLKDLSFRIVFQLKCIYSNWIVKQLTFIQFKKYNMVKICNKQYSIKHIGLINDKYIKLVTVYFKTHLVVLLQKSDLFYSRITD